MAQGNVVPARARYAECGSDDGRAVCRTPLAAYASWRGRELWLRGLIASRDGRRVLRGERSTVVTEAGAAARLGDALGAEFLARGAAAILAEAS